MAMLIARAKRSRRRRARDGGERAVDRISHLPDTVLGDIVSLLPTRHGARTQVLSSWWRHIWRCAPLNVDLQDHAVRHHVPAGEVTRILSAHPGPGRRFSIPDHYLGYHIPGHNPGCSDSVAETLDGWLRSPALDNLRELEFDYDLPNRQAEDDWFGWYSRLPRPRSPPHPPPPLPASVHRFSSTLLVASFGRCSLPDGDEDAAAAPVHLPVLRQLSLLDVTNSDFSSGISIYISGSLPPS
ncbi:hypothetical protein BAE44_0017345 [Dichanthelium oligosanthes]|uniref:F-box/LRR-repeat protein 15/At3g58940/PEG3-like LRR domain-containing protein n=1 Tax=Dichanthelium oligosanthes TaxID=888268 RepID=A0A1E5V9E2_9POAL|nr:hypothetical protein BAE44_0017345 [Dichanthelium oligosanthes]